MGAGCMRKGAGCVRTGARQCRDEGGEPLEELDTPGGSLHRETLGHEGQQRLEADLSHPLVERLERRVAHLPNEGRGIELSRVRSQTRAVLLTRLKLGARVSRVQCHARGANATSVLRMMAGKAGGGSRVGGLVGRGKAGGGSGVGGLVSG
jgi:hypothetical protein